MSTRLALALLAGACTPASPAREERAALASAREEAPAPVREAAAPAAPTSPAPEIVIVAEIGVGEVAPVVQNHDRAPARLASGLLVEREGPNGFAALDGAALALRASCEESAAPCFDLVPGAELRPPSWRASGGRAQCGESPAPKAEPGRYRFVARTCDGGTRIDGDAFELH